MLTVNTESGKLTKSVLEQEIIDVIGFTATLKLEQAFGASYIYVPAKAPSKAIINAIGLTAALQLVEHFGCSDLWVPKSLLKQQRNRAIFQEKAAGKTLPELAKKFRTGIPNIRRILKERADRTA